MGDPRAPRCAGPITCQFHREREPKPVDSIRSASKFGMKRAHVTFCPISRLVIGGSHPPRPRRPWHADVKGAGICGHSHEKIRPPYPLASRKPALVYDINTAPK